MHDSRNIAIASLLGTPLAGFLLLAWNYFVGRHFAPALGCLLLGAYANVTLCAVLRTLVVYAHPRLLAAPGIALSLSASLTLAAAMYVLAKTLQSTSLKEHTAKGGRLARPLPAAVCGLITRIGLQAPLIAWILLDSTKQ